MKATQLINTRGRRRVPMQNPTITGQSRILDQFDGRLHRSNQNSELPQRSQDLVSYIDHEQPCTLFHQSGPRAVLKSTTSRSVSESYSYSFC